MTFTAPGTRPNWWWSRQKPATGKQEAVGVTPWRPFWANDAFPVWDLEDPKGTMGDEADAIDAWLEE